MLEISILTNLINSNQQEILLGGSGDLKNKSSIIQAIQADRQPMKIK